MLLKFSARPMRFDNGLRKNATKNGSRRVSGKVINFKKGTY